MTVRTWGNPRATSNLNCLFSIYNWKWMNLRRKTFLVECVRSRAASCKKRREFWRKTPTPLWLVIGPIISLTWKNIANTIGRVIFFMCENHLSLLWLARTHLCTKIYNIAFWWVFLSTYTVADPDLQIRVGGSHPDPDIRGGRLQK